MTILSSIRIQTYPYLKGYFAHIFHFYIKKSILLSSNILLTQSIEKRFLYVHSQSNTLTPMKAPLSKKAVSFILHLLVITLGCFVAGFTLLCCALVGIDRLLGLVPHEGIYYIVHNDGKNITLRKLVQIPNQKTIQDPDSWIFDEEESFSTKRVLGDYSHKEFAEFKSGYIVYTYSRTSEDLLADFCIDKTEAASSWFLTHFYDEGAQEEDTYLKQSTTPKTNE